MANQVIHSITAELMKSVLINGIINENGLSAGANGYIEISVTIPSGYKTTGITTINIGHPGTAGGLVLTTGVSRGVSGSATIYVSYYAPHAIANGAHTDFSIILLCVQSGSNIIS